jgi:hypothetical protein
LSALACRSLALRCRNCACRWVRVQSPISARSPLGSSAVPGERPIRSSKLCSSGPNFQGALARSTNQRARTETLALRVGGMPGPSSGPDLHLSRILVHRGFSTHARSPSAARIWIDAGWRSPQILPPRTVSIEVTSQIFPSTGHNTAHCHQKNRRVGRARVPLASMADNKRFSITPTAQNSASLGLVAGTRHASPASNHTRLRMTPNFPLERSPKCEQATTPPGSTALVLPLCIFIVRAWPSPTLFARFRPNSTTSISKPPKEYRRALSREVLEGQQTTSRWLLPRESLKA